MKFEGTLIVVRDMEKSRNFYESLLNQEAKLDVGANVAYEGFSLQTLEYWKHFLDKVEDDINLSKNNSSELYFEITDYDGFIIEIVHKTKEFPWGQRVIRFYDPDNHMIEVGESMDSVVKNFFDDGMSVEEVAEKTGFPMEHVVDLKNKFKK